MTYRTINPSTGEVMQSFDTISDAELARALEVAHSCFENVWRAKALSHNGRP